MKRAFSQTFLSWLGLAILGLVIILAMASMLYKQPVHALPEYAERTGEACGACHVNPGGGGPRTMRGLLWAAQGQPDDVPKLGNVLLAPDVEDGAELYDIACASCHGFAGEGLFGTALTGSGLRDSKILSSVERGREKSGMPGYEGQFTAEQLDALVEFVAGISSGKIEPQPQSYALPPAQFSCSPADVTKRCGGN